MTRRRVSPRGALQPWLLLYTGIARASHLDKWAMALRAGAVHSFEPEHK